MEAVSAAGFANSDLVRRQLLMLFRCYTASQAARQPADISEADSAVAVPESLSSLSQTTEKHV